MSKQIIIGGVSLKEKLILVKQLHAGIKAGYSVLEALEIASLQAKGRLKQILFDIADMIDNGAYLYEAIGKYTKYFSPLFISLIKTGEMSGALEENLKRLFDVLSNDIEFRQKMRSAMLYPTFIFISIIGLGLSVSILILPNLIPLFKSIGTELPFTTRVLLHVAEAYQSLTMGSVLIYTGFLLLLIGLLKHSILRPFTHWLMLKLPIIGPLNKNLILTRFSQTFRSLLSSGIPIDRSFEIMSSVISNHTYKTIVLHSLPLIKKGRNFSDILRNYPEYFDDMFIAILALGEKTGSTEDSFDYLAEFYGNEANERMKIFSISLEPILLIFVGLIVGFVALAILGPIYSLTGSIR